MIRPTVHIIPERKRTFTKKRSSNRKNLKAPGLRGAGGGSRGEERKKGSLRLQISSGVVWTENV